MSSKLRHLEKIKLCIFINNIPEYHKDIINFINKLKLLNDDDKCKYIYLKNIDNLPYLQLKIFEITQKISRTNILVFFYGYGYGYKTFYLNYFYLGEYLLSLNILLNTLAKNKPNEYALILFSNIKYAKINNEIRIIHEELEFENIAHFNLQLRSNNNDDNNNNYNSNNKNKNQIKSLLLNTILDDGLFSKKRNFYYLCQKLTNKLQDITHNDVSYECSFFLHKTLTIKIPALLM